MSKEVSSPSKYLSLEKLRTVTNWCKESYKELTSEDDCWKLEYI